MKLPNDAALAAYVEESNAIEGIFAPPGTPLWDDHLAIARTVRDAPGGPMPPELIHGQLMQAEADKLPGLYRRPVPELGLTGDVTVGGELKMPWADVPDRA